jgi:hypothetical protein
VRINSPPSYPQPPQIATTQSYFQEAVYRALGTRSAGILALVSRFDNPVCARMQIAIQLKKEGVPQLQMGRAQGDEAPESAYCFQ